MQRQIQECAARERVGAEARGLRLVVGPLRGAEFDCEGGAAIVAHGEPLVLVRNQHGHVRPEGLRDDASGGVDHLLGLQQARQIAREFVERARALLAVRRDSRLITQAGGHLADDERNRQHHGEGQQVLHIAHREGKPRRHEEEIEGGDADERRQDRRAAPELHGDQHHGQQEQHHDVGEVEVRQQGSAASVVNDTGGHGPQRKAASAAPPSSRDGRRSATSQAPRRGRFR